MKNILLLTAMIACGAALAGEPAVITRLKTEKIRGTSAALAGDVKVKVMKDAGLNTAVTWSYFLKDCPVAPKNANEPLFDPAALPQSKAMRNEARLAAKYDMISLPLLWFHNDTVPVLAQKNYRRAVMSDGRLCKVTPCPADAVFWDDLVKPFLLHMAEIQKEEGASGGGAVDLEFYAGELIGGFTYARGLDGCFCDDCFGGFLKQDAKNIPLEARWEYLVKRNQYQAYLKHISGRVAERTAAIREAVHAVKPDFVFAVLPGGDGWYFDGLGKGFGTADVPMLMFSESEYFSGWSTRSAEYLKNIRENNLPVLFAGGLTVSAYNAEGLGAKMLEMTDKCDGYWLYYGESLFSATPKIVERSFRPSEYALREAPKRYWQAVTAANKWLDSGSALSSGAAVTLAIIDGIAVPGEPMAFKGQLGDNWTLVPVELTGHTKELPASNEVKLPWTKTAEGFLFDLTGKAPGYFSLKQTVDVTPKQKYRIRMEMRTENVSSSNGFEITETYSKNPYFRHWEPSTNGEWRSIERMVTPYNPKVDVRLLVSGTTGKVEFRNIAFEELREFDFTSAKLSEMPSVLVMENPEPVGVEIINPETELGYFKLENGTNDLRWLKTLYPALPAAVRISGEIGKDCRTLKIRITGN